MKRSNMLITISIILVVLISATIYIFFNKYLDNSKNNKENVNVEIIADYNYTLEERDSRLYKENFQLLKEEIEKDDIIYENYAKLIAKLYIIDLYTISNKVNQYDVGGSEFVHIDARENFELKVKDTLYKYLEDNSDGEREQKLPSVSSIETAEVEEKSFKIADKELNGYSVKLAWVYENDLGYDTEAVVNIVNDNNKLYVISQSVLDK